MLTALGLVLSSDEVGWGKRHSLVFYVCDYFACVRIHVLCIYAWCTWRPKRVSDLLELDLKASFKSVSGYWKSKKDPQEDKLVFLTSEPSL